jgi:hypothetical protein
MIGPPTGLFYEPFLRDLNHIARTRDKLLETLLESKGAVLVEGAKMA